MFALCGRQECGAYSDSERMNVLSRCLRGALPGMIPDGRGPTLAQRARKDGATTEGTCS